MVLVPNKLLFIISVLGSVKVSFNHSALTLLLLLQLGVWCAETAGVYSKLWWCAASWAWAMPMTPYKQIFSVATRPPWC